MSVFGKGALVVALVLVLVILGAVGVFTIITAINENANTAESIKHVGPAFSNQPIHLIYNGSGYLNYQTSQTITLEAYEYNVENSGVLYDHTIDIMGNRSAGQIKIKYMTLTSGQTVMNECGKRGNF